MDLTISHSDQKRQPKKNRHKKQKQYVTIIMWSFLKLSLLTQAVAFPHLLHAEDDNQHKAAGDAEKLPLRRALQQQTDLIDNIKEDIEALVIGTPTLAAKFVRLVFHDCVGGCNGCIDFQNVSGFSGPFCSFLLYTIYAITIYTISSSSNYFS